MRLESIGTVIANREFILDKIKKVSVQIGKPEKFQNSEDYYCPYQIVGVGDGKIRHAGGIDSIQALLLALKKIGTDLSSLDVYKTGDLKWEGGEKGDLGFP